MKKKDRKKAENTTETADSSTVTAENTAPERDPEVSSGNLLRQLVLPFYLLEVFAALVIAVLLMLTGGSTTKLSFIGSSDSLNSCSFQAQSGGVKSTRLININTDPTEIEITLPVREADTITITVKAEKPALLRDFRIDSRELQGTETLSLRLERHAENTKKVVEFLKNHPQVEKVNHPSIEDHPDHELYKKYFPNGGGSIFTFEIKGGKEEAWKFIDGLKIFSLLANVADVKSLVIHPASTTHSQLSDEELLDQGIKQNTIRLSIGTENINDIIEDLEAGFAAAK